MVGIKKTVVDLIRKQGIGDAKGINVIVKFLTQNFLRNDIPHPFLIFPHPAAITDLPSSIPRF